MDTTAHRAHSADGRTDSTSPRGFRTAPGCRPPLLLLAGPVSPVPAGQALGRRQPRGGRCGTRSLGKACVLKVHLPSMLTRVAFANKPCSFLKLSCCLLLLLLLHLLFLLLLAVTRCPSQHPRPWDAPSRLRWAGASLCVSEAGGVFVEQPGAHPGTAALPPGARVLLGTVLVVTSRGCQQGGRVLGFRPQLQGETPSAQPSWLQAALGWAAGPV